MPTIADWCFTVAYRRRWRGVHFAHRTWVAAGGRAALRCRNSYDAIFDLKVYDHIDSTVLNEGYYESEVMEALRPYLGRGAVLWDIGANFGLHAITAKYLAPETAVHAFEPFGESAARLSHHARLNHVDVTLWPVALGNADGFAELHVVGPGNPGMNTLAPWSEATYVSTQRVRVQRAEHLIASGDAPAPTVIKIDVEGGELAALTGLGSHLAKTSLRAVVFEASVDLLAMPASDPVGALLTGAGFSLQSLSRHENTAHALGNFIAVRP